MTIRDIAIAFGVEVNDDSVKKAEQSITKLKSFATKALAMIGIGFSLVKMRALIEEWYSVDKVLKTVKSDLSDFSDLQDYITKAANNCRLEYSAMADYVASLVKTGSSFFSTAEDAADFLELANKAFQVSGASASEISSLNSVLTTTFNTGKLSASGFTSIMNTCPDIVNYLADSLGMTTQQVKALGLSGTITAKQLYNALYNSADAIGDAYENLSLTITDALTIIKNEWGTWLAQMNETYDITNTIAKVMIRAFRWILSVVKSVMNAFDRLVSLLHSTKAAFALVAAAITAVIVAFKWKSIVSGLQNIASALTGVGGKILLVVGLIILIILLIDDLIAFANGDDSLIGAMFEKAGVDAEGLRSALQELFAAFTKIFNLIMPIIKQLISTLLPVLQKLFSAQMEILAKVLEVVINLVVTLLDMVMPILEILIEILDSVISFLEPIIDLVLVIVDVIVALIEVVLELIKPLLELITAILQPIISLVKVLADMLNNNLSNAFSFIGSIIQGVINQFSGLLDFLQQIIKFISAVFSGDWESAWKALGNIPIAIINGIISGFESLVNFFVNAINLITGALSSLWTWIGIPAIPQIPEVSFGRLSYLAEGGYIGKNKPTPVVIGDNPNEGEIVAPESKLRKTVAEALAEFINDDKDDKDDKKPVNVIVDDDREPQPSVIIRDDKDKRDIVTPSKLKEILTDVLTMSLGNLRMSSNQQSAQTLQRQINNRNVTQTVYMYNTFEGSKDVQKTTSKAMKSAGSDLTSELASAIAYTR